MTLVRRRQLTLVVVVAFLARLVPLLQGGGLGGITNYDDSVYYAGADALAHGRLPYRDFLLLHPPGILLVLLPFAELGRVVGDPAGFALARLGFMLLGAVNAGLVLLVSRRYGPVAGLTGGLLYALWPPAVYAEGTTLLTPLNNLGLLVALLLLTGHRSTSTRFQAWAGLALGCSTAVKIWGVVPLLVVVLWCLLRTGRAAATRVLLAAAAAVTAVCLPFFLPAPAAMSRMLLLDQLGRSRSGESTVQRVAAVLAVRPFGLHGGGAPRVGLLVAGVLVLAVAACGAWVRRTWLLAALAVVQAGLLVLSPPFFPHYAAFLAPPLLLMTAAGAQLLADRVPRPLPAATAVFVGLVYVAVLALTQRGSAFPGVALGAAVQDRRCVTADSPVALIGMDVLSRDLARGCPLWVDVTGITYDRAALSGPNGRRLPRARNPVWQRALTGYLTTGDATILVRRDGDGLDATSRVLVARLPVLRRVGRYKVYGVPRG